MFVLFVWRSAPSGCHIKLVLDWSGFAFLIVLKRWCFRVLVLFRYFFMESLILAQDERWRRA